MSRIVGLLMGAGVASMISSAAAFNSHNSAQDVSGLACVFGPDNYMEEVAPGDTSKGWYYTKASTLELSVTSQEDVCLPETTNCVVKCAEDVTTRCTIGAHQQQVISNAKCGGNNSDAAIVACFGVTEGLTYDLSCPQ